jgi:hypothetical protein
VSDLERSGGCRAGFCPSVLAKGDERGTATRSLQHRASRAFGGPGEALTPTLSRNRERGPELEAGAEVGRGRTGVLGKGLAARCSTPLGADGTIGKTRELPTTPE